MQYFYSKAEDGKFETCERYDLSGLRIPTNYQAAMNSRPQSLSKIPCDASGVDLKNAWMYDTSEKIFSIVNDVSS